MASRLDLDFALFHKERKKANEVSRMVLVGHVKDKTAILVDDMADTCGTLALASKHLVDAGAKDVIALVTHGILSGPAYEKIADSALSKLIVTNTIPQVGHLAKCKQLEMVDVSHVLAETIRRSYYGESVSYLYVEGQIHSAWAVLLSCFDYQGLMPSPLPRWSEWIVSMLTFRTTCTYADYMPFTEYDFVCHGALRSHSNSFSLLAPIPKIWMKNRMAF